MTTKISIYNLALAQLIRSPIVSLKQENEKACRLNLFYASVRHEILRTYNWTFAGVQEPLALMAFPGRGWAMTVCVQISGRSLIYPPRLFSGPKNIRFPRVFPNRSA